MAICAIGGLCGWRFARLEVGCWRLAVAGWWLVVGLAVGSLLLAVCAVSGRRSWLIARMAVCAVGGLCGWRFVRLAVCAIGGWLLAVGGCRLVVGSWVRGWRLAVCCWRFARLVVGAVGGLRGWRFARLAVCAVGGLRGWRFAQLAVCAVGGLRGWRFA